MASQLASRWTDDDAYSPRLHEADARRIVEEAVGIRGSNWVRPEGLREFDTWVVDDEWVVRMARRPADAAKLERERKLLRSIALPVAVPKIDRRSRGIAVHRLVPGVSAAERPPAEVAWPALAAEVGAILRVLHATTKPIASQAGLETSVPEAPDALHRRVVWALSQLDGQDLPQGLDALADEVAAMRDSRRDDLVVCYGDFKAEHVLLCDEGTHLAGIIDWADVDLCPRQSEFQRLVAWLGPRFARLVASHYDHPVDLDGAIIRARAWVVISLAQAVADLDDWPAEHWPSTAHREQAIKERQSHWTRAVVTAFDE